LYLNDNIGKEKFSDFLWKWGARQEAPDREGVLDKQGLQIGWKVFLRLLA